MFRYGLRCLFILIFCLFASVAFAEIACECNERECRCFIQVGDEGVAIGAIAELLIEQGYLSSSLGKTTFDNQMLNAVHAFQIDHGLTDTGMLDNDSLTYLIWGMDSASLDYTNPDSDGDSVWVPTDGGKKRHRKQSCSGMLDPRVMSVRNAEKLGIEPCKRCNPK